MTAPNGFDESLDLTNKSLKELENIVLDPEVSRVERRAVEVRIEVVKLHDYIQKIVWLGAFLIAVVFIISIWTLNTIKADKAQQTRNHQTGLGNKSVVCAIAARQGLTDPGVLSYCAGSGTLSNK